MNTKKITVNLALATVIIISLVFEVYPLKNVQNKMR